MNIQNVLRFARAIVRAEEDDPVPGKGPLQQAIAQLRKELTPKPSIMDVLRSHEPDRRFTARPKEVIVRSETYRRLVAMRPCKFCGVIGYSQVAHENRGKGMGMKVDDRRTFPLCNAGANDCHHKFDHYEMFHSRVDHVAMGKKWARETAEEIHAEGLWPHNLEYPY